MEWATSYLVYKYPVTSHGVFFVNAVSKAEAIGLSMQIVHKLYPTNIGWSGHDCVVKSMEDLRVTLFDCRVEKAT